jgi:hypothetical protein
MQRVVVLASARLLLDHATLPILGSALGRDEADPATWRLSTDTLRIVDEPAPRMT